MERWRASLAARRTPGAGWLALALPGRRAGPRSGRSGGVQLPGAGRPGAGGHRREGRRRRPADVDERIAEGDGRSCWTTAAPRICGSPAPASRSTRPPRCGTSTRSRPRSRRRTSGPTRRRNGIWSAADTATSGTTGGCTRWPRRCAPPGATTPGRWNVPLRVDGAPTAITGGLYYAPDPSPVWFWPIVVAVLCVLAGLRLRRPELDRAAGARPGGGRADRVRGRRPGPPAARPARDHGRPAGRARRSSSPSPGGRRRA